METATTTAPTTTTTATTTTATPPGHNLDQNTHRLFDEQRQKLYIRTDKLFGVLLVLEWIAGIITALLFSPLAWSGDSSNLHIHVVFATVFGAGLAFFPVALIFAKPGSVLTRHVIATSQMLFSAMYIHLCGGRIETHFHIFGSLALLAFYRDWRVIMTASTVTALDHFVRGYFWPQSIFGVNFASPWRAVEHIAWVIFADTFLLQGIAQSVHEMHDNAVNTAQLERTNELVERAIAETTSKLLEGEIELHRLAAVVQQSSDAIVSMGTDGTIRSWNDGAQRLYQYTAEEMVGRMFNPTLPKNVRNENLAVLEELKNGKTIESMVTINSRKDGELIDVSLTISPIRGADDQINAFAIVSRDFTQKKIAERRISEFYSVISHELRTPLTSIRGALALIFDEIVEPGSDEAKELIEIAQKSTSRLIRLINDILDLRKIEAGQFELNLSDLSSKKLLESTVNSMRGFADEKKVSLSIAVSDDYQIEGDEDRLTQVLSNLISNALKYAPEGSDVSVAAIRSNHSMQFTVTDHGPGIPPEYHSKLFGKFQQVDASDTRAKEGSGLGLAISKAIVEQHGGTIFFESKPGVKTVFTFEVPLSSTFIFGGDAQLQSNKPQSLRTTQPTPTTPTTQTPIDSSMLGTAHTLEHVSERSPSAAERSSLDRTRKILVVEDDTELVSLLRINLEQQGYECFTAQTLDDARALIVTERPDAIVLELELPDGDGLSLLELLGEKTQSGGRTPVIVITGSDRAIKKEEPSIVDWLFKPFHQGNSSDAVHRALK